MSIYNSLGIGTIKYNSGSLKCHGWSCGKELKVLIMVLPEPKLSQAQVLRVRGHMTE